MPARVLLIEDNEDTTRLIAGALRSASDPCEVTAVAVCAGRGALTAAGRTVVEVAAGSGYERAGRLAFTVELGTSLVAYFGGEAKT